MPNTAGTRQYTMSRDAYNQRVKYGFRKDMRYSGAWTMVRMRPEQRDALKRKFGSLKAAFDYAEKGR